MQNSTLTLLLMAGLPGAGKTTLSKELGRDLGWYVINKDTHKQVLLDMRVNEDLAGRAAYQLAFTTAREILLSKQSSVILDCAALYTFILDEVLTIINEIEDVQLKVILCVADRDLRNKRLRDRPTQITAIHVDPETIADYLHYFKHLPPEPRRLTIYTNRPLQQCVEEAKNFLMH